MYDCVKELEIRITNRRYVAKWFPISRSFLDLHIKAGNIPREISVVKEFISYV